MVIQSHLSCKQLLTPSHPFVTIGKPKSSLKMSVLAEASLTPLLDLLSIKGGDTSGTAGSIVGHVTAEPSLAPLLCKKLGEQVTLHVSSIILQNRLNDSLLTYDTQLLTTDRGADSVIIVTNALRTFEALANRCIVLAEAHLALQLPAMLAAASHKQAPVRAAAEAAVLAFASKMSANAVPLVLKDFFTASEVGVAWQSRALALKAIASLADHAPEQLGASLPDVVPQVTISMNETKKEVSQAALEAMTAACEVIGNRDIEHMTTKIVRSITNPEVSR